MSISGIQGQILEVTVVGCTKLKDTEWFSRQDPYVCLEYASTKFRTRTCTDGGRNPTFQEKFVFTLIEGLREITVMVWNSNTINFDDFIGSGKIQLHKVLSEGFDDTAWPLQTKTGRHAGEVKLIMHYANAKKHASSHAPSAPPYHYSAPPSASYPPQPSSAHSYPPPPPSSAHSYPPPPTTAYPASSPYPSYSSAYPPPPYPPHPAAAYPPPPAAAYPPPPYPPPSSYPSPHQPSSTYHTPGHYPGHYPPPPY